MPLVRTTADTFLGLEEAAPSRLDARVAVAAYRRLLADLQAALTRDRARARELLRRALGAITLVPDAEGVAAEFAAPSPLASVAGSDVQREGVAGARTSIRL